MSMPDPAEPHAGPAGPAQAGPAAAHPTAKLPVAAGWSFLAAHAGPAFHPAGAMTRHG